MSTILRAKLGSHEVQYVGLRQSNSPIGLYAQRTGMVGHRYSLLLPTWRKFRHPVKIMTSVAKSDVLSMLSHSMATTAIMAKYLRIRNWIDSALL
jgi:hypothetical protein